jgi:hypothetical protein
MAGEGHQEQANVIGFGFLVAVVTQVSERGQDTAAGPLFTCDPLAGMMRKGMRNLVRQDRRKLAIVFARDRKDAREHKDLAGRQAERVDLLIAKDVRLPVETIAAEAQVNLALQGLDFRGAGDAMHDVPDAANDRLAGW